MSFATDCFAALDREKVFENSGHRTRFKELLDCYGGYPFFSKGLCKCICPHGTNSTSVLCWKR